MNKRDVYVNAKSGRHKNRLLWWHVFWRPSVGRRTVRRPSLIFSSYPLKYLNGIDQNLTGSKIEDIFEFSETAELNLTKVDRKQYLNTIYQVCGFFFSGRSEKQDDRPASDWIRHFRPLLWNLKPLNRIWSIRYRQQDLNVLYHVFFNLMG